MRNETAIEPELLHVESRAAVVDSNDVASIGGYSVWARVAQPICLAFFDSLAIFLAFFSAYWIRNGLIYRWTMLRYEWTQNHLVFLLAFAALTIILFRYLGLYKDYIYTSGLRQATMLIKSTALQGLLIITVAYYGNVQLLLESRIIVAAFLGCLFVELLVFRLVLFRRIRRTVFSKEAMVRGVLVVSDGPTAENIFRFLTEMYGNEKRCVGWLGPHEADGLSQNSAMPYLGLLTDFEAVLVDSGASEVYITDTGIEITDVVDILDMCRRRNVDVNVDAELFGIAGEKIGATFFGGGKKFISFSSVLVGKTLTVVKRIVDVMIALAVIVICWPLMLAIAGLIRRDSPGPATYKQERVGLNGEPFIVYKYRTMRKDTDPQLHRKAVHAFANGDEAFFQREAVAHEGAQTKKVTASGDVTRFGRLLRRTSLDELPQIFNVLKGEMSIVGPRPLPVYELEYFKPWQMSRFKVKPGITGLWQVTARSEVSFDDMICLDLYYVFGWSLMFDVWILIRTFPAVINARGAH